ncbi:MAG TPA: ABC transporter permease [Terriglobales bacterium]
METLLGDIRYGVRMLLKTPWSSVAALLTLTLGIGANTALFSAMNSLMLRPLPVRNADRLAVIAPKLEGDDGYNKFSYLEFRDLRAQTETMSGVLAYSLAILGLEVAGRAEPIVISEVSGNFFQALGLEPAAGRLAFGEPAEKPGAEPVIVLGYTYWKKRFNSDRGILGQSVKLNGRSVTVVGVAPEGFHGLCSLVDIEAYVPLGVKRLWSQNDDLWAKRETRSLSVLGFLKPGVSLRQAQASADVVIGRLLRQYPEAEKGISLRVIPEPLARPEPDASAGLVVVGLLFTVLSGLVLLLACSNVANILLVRAVAREREMAVRAALGAGRIRLARQLLTESLVLAVLGSASGLALGYAISRLLSSAHVEALNVPLLFDLSFDWRVFTFAMASTALTAILAGLAPAWRAVRSDINQVLQENTCGRSAGAGPSALRNAAVVAQMAGSLVLLVIAALFLRSSSNAEHADLGFDPRQVLNFAMDTENIGFEPPRSRQFYRELEEQVSRLPGVTSVSLASFVPMGYVNNTYPVYPEGQTSDANAQAFIVQFAAVDSEYFATMKTPIVQGRAFNTADTEKSPPVAIVNEAMARRFWPRQVAIGQRFRTKDAATTEIEIVGIAKQGKYGSPAEEPAAFFYLPQTQNPTSYRVLQIRTATTAGTLIPLVERKVHSLAPGLPVFGVETMEQTLEGGNGLLLFRIGTYMTAILGMLGLALAWVGVYGVTSHLAAERTHEIGVRMALGADRRDILKLVLRQGSTMVGTGVFTGLVLTFAATRGLQNLLMGVSPADPLTFATVASLLATTGMVACYIPARRAMKVEPVRALKWRQ